MKFCTFCQQGVEQVGIISSNNQSVYALKELDASMKKMEDLIEHYGALKNEIAQKMEQLTPIPLGPTARFTRFEK